MTEVIAQFKKAVNELNDTLNKNKLYSTQTREDNPYKFEYKNGRATYYKNAVGRDIRKVRKAAWNLVGILDSMNEMLIYRSLSLSFKMEKENRLGKDISKTFSEIMDCTLSLKKPVGIVPTEISVDVPNLPEQIRSDMFADLNEIKKCFDAQCYRSATVLCGRVLETALHRKYYEKTEKDLLETSPGIGLGTLIGKLAESNVRFDPGITQQIHLINQVRVYTVHKKKEAFHPSKQQCHAMILYTLDVLKKLFEE